MKILYRISDGGNNKAKPAYVYDKQKMFLHFIAIFKNHDIFVFADNVGETTYQFLKEHFEESKIIRISLGNSKSFKYSMDFAISNFDDHDKIYFAEDDYIYKKIAPQIIEEGLDISDYCSGYDHPDKYINHHEGGPNPFIQLGGESTRVIVSKNTHWKFTNSCCMTFATTLKIIKEDYKVFEYYCQWANPLDFNIFSELKTYRKLISCIPGVCSHGETEFLGKFVDWDEEFENSRFKYI
jgi:hypothetical protein